MNKHTISKKFAEAQDSLVLQSADLSLKTIADMVKSKAIDADPKYQRRERWSHDKQSALIESFILNIPIPPIYLAEDDYGTYSVIDGKQRITAIACFMDDELSLRNLQRFRQIEGFTFSDLPADVRNALTIRPYVRVVTLLKQSDPGIKYEVFTRLNTGGEPLIPQEIRNVAYRGSLNDLVYELAETPFLRQQLKIKDQRSKPFRMMTDAEFVLRFFTLLDEWKDFSGMMRVSMDRYMMAHQNDGDRNIAALRQTYESATRTCQDIWGEASFKRYSGGMWRNQLLSGMYDAEMIAVSLLTDEERARALANSGAVLEATKGLLADDEQFEASVRQFTSNPERVEYRVSAMCGLLRGVESL
jgi:hypothetical protein